MASQYKIGLEQFSELEKTSVFTFVEFLLNNPGMIEFNCALRVVYRNYVVAISADNIIFCDKQTQRTFSSNQLSDHEPLFKNICESFTHEDIINVMCSL